MYYISVIIPCYNAAVYIEKAIDSVINQKVQAEIIVVDDHSMDDTPNILEKYMHLDGFSYYRLEENKGVAYARNFGVSKAKCEYIAFLDADDVWREDKIEKQLKRLKETNAVLCFSGRQIITDSGDITNHIIDIKESVSFIQLSMHNEISCSSVVMKKSIAKEIPMEHDEYHEDYLMWLKCIKKYGNAVGINEPLIYYRKSKNGKSRNLIKSIRMVYGVHRCMGRGIILSCFFTMSHISHAVLKYL